MFLIVAKWKDNSDMIFLVGSDPDNKKLPHWAEVFEKLDTIADPSDAVVRFARISRDFILMREDENGFSVSDDRTCDELRPLKLPGDVVGQWYDVLNERRQQLGDMEDEQEF